MAMHGVCVSFLCALQRGGIQLPNDAAYQAPLYRRLYPPRGLVLHTLDRWSEQLGAYCEKAIPVGEASRLLLDTQAMLCLSCVSGCLSI